MKNKITFAISVILLATALLACKFNMGSNTSTDSGSSNSTNRSSAKSDAPKTGSNAKRNDKTDDGERTGDDVAEREDAPDSDSSGSTDFRINRSFYALDANRPKDLLYQDGDYMWFQKLESGGTAGYFYSAPKKEIYVLWAGKVIAGPLTTRQQVDEVTAMLSNNMKAEHDIRMSIISKYPTGILGPVRVYDEKGRLIREQ